MGGVVRPEPIVTPDEDEFRRWQQQRGAETATPDENEFQAWQQNRAARATTRAPANPGGDIDLRTPEDRVRLLAPPPIRADATAVAPNARATYRPSVVERAGAQVGQFVRDAAEHPGQVAAQLITAPIKSAFDAVVTPEIGEARHDPRLSKGGNSSGRPIDLTPYDREHGAISPQERTAAGLQTLANVAFPGIESAVAERVAAAGASPFVAKLTGLAAAGAPAGAAYSPGDPVAGTLAGSFLAPVLGAAHEDVVRTARAGLDVARPAIAAGGDHLRQLVALAAQQARPVIDPEAAVRGTLSEQPTPVERTVAHREVTGEPSARDVSAPDRTADEHVSADVSEPMPERPAEPAHQFRDVIGMSTEELARLADEATTRDANLERDLFGEQGAARYAAVQRRANGQFTTPEQLASASAEIDAMENKLSEADRNRLYGIGQSGLNAEELRAASRAANDYARPNVDALSDDDLRSTVARELTTGRPHQDAVSALRLRGAVEELQRRTGDPLDQILRDGVLVRGQRGYLSSAADASELFRARMQELQDTGLFRDAGAAPTEHEGQGHLGSSGEPQTPDDAEFQHWQEERQAGPVLVDDEGVQRFASARTPAGGRRPVARVSTTGLLDELLDLEQKRADAESGAVYEVRDDPNFHTDGIPQIVSTKSRGGGPSRQAKALTNLEAFRRAQSEIEVELATRGLSGEALTERLRDHHETREERRALAGDFDPGNINRQPVMDDATGARLFSATPDAFAPARTPRPTPQAGTEVAATRAAAQTPPVARSLALQRIVSRGNAYLDSFRRVFAPAARSEEAGRVALAVRAHAGDFARRNEQARESMREFAAVFDRMPTDDRLDFIDRIETGQPQPTPELQNAANLMRRLLDDGRDAIRALGTGKLEQWIANYFPHVWENPDDALTFVDRVMSKRNLAGPGTFLKQRSIPTLKEGIAAGLEPLTTNPIDMTLLKLREMNKYLAGQRILAELKESGLATFHSALEKPPQSLVKLDDKLGTVYGAPHVTVTEGFDALVRQDLEGIMKELGVTHVRKPNLGGAGRMGYAEGDKLVVSKSAGPDTVIEHELGHILDARLNLWDRLTDIPGKDRTAIDMRKQLHAELRALADLRIERSDPATVAESYKKYLRKKEEKIANAIHALIYMPERMEDVAPMVKARMTAILKAFPIASKILDIEPSLVLGADTFHVPTGGLVVKGHWYLPEPVGRLLNNHLSPGLRGNPFFDLYRGVGNMMNQWQLGFSAFHLGFTSMDAAVSKSALAVEQMAAGKPASAVASIARTPLAPVENYLRGSKVLREYLKPGTEGGEMAEIVDALVKGGGRVRMDEFYGGGAIKQFREAMHRGRYGSAAKLSLGAIAEASSKLVMEHIVPRQKLGVFADLARFELERLPETATKEEVRAVMARAWDSVDNRMGQLVYDNLFWHRVAKDLTMAGVRSVGWNLGTVREIGGGALDLGRAVRRPSEGLSHRAAYVIALPITVGLAGAIVNYLYTGEAPHELKDFYFPRTGRRNPDGTFERVQLPSYMRDVFDYGRHPVRTLVNKAHPLLGTLRDMLNNTDFYGHQIRNPDDPMVQQLAQEATYLAGQYQPFSARNAIEQVRRGEGRTALLNSVGITPAPRDETRTAADLRMSEELGRRARGELTPEEVERQRDRRGVTDALRSHDPSAADKLRAGIGHGTIAPSDVKGLTREASVPADVARFSRLPLAEAMHVYQLATPGERARYQPVLMKKLATARQRGARLPSGTLAPGAP